jgi:isopentenyl diphosphate isomerase/L-lactate dehydrogenase-like FMN-dependent dehydrogenase
MTYLSIDDVRAAAQRRLPKTAFGALDGGGGDELTLRRNCAAFDDLLLRPRSLADVSQRDFSTTVLGSPVSMPLLVAPVGYARMAHRDAEKAIVQAAAAAGTISGVSTFTSYPLEEIAIASDAALWYQIYPPADRGAREALVERAVAAHCRALCVTVDSPVPGQRRRELRSRLQLPLRPTPRLLRECLLRPRWLFDYALGGVGRGRQGLPPVTRSATGARTTPAANTIVTPEIVAHLREIWPGSLVIKGVLRGDDAQRFLGLGADAIIVSNHGARQLDSVPATIEVLPEVVEAVAGRAEVFVDGGIRRGTDVAKALLLGARAVLIGRPVLYGLAAGGRQGVEDVLDFFRIEIDRTLALLGCASLADLEPTMLIATRHLRARTDD